MNLIGSEDVPVLTETMGSFFDGKVKELQDKEAVVVMHQNKRWTWKQFQKEVDALAVGFVRLGLKPGDRVAVWLPNTAEYLAAQFATAKVGLIMVTINPAYRIPELKYLIFWLC